MLKWKINGDRSHRKIRCCGACVSRELRSCAGVWAVGIKFIILEFYVCLRLFYGCFLVNRGSGRNMVPNSLCLLPGSLCCSVCLELIYLFGVDISSFCTRFPFSGRCTYTEHTQTFWTLSTDYSELCTSAWVEVVYPLVAAYGIFLYLFLILYSAVLVVLKFHSQIWRRNQCLDVTRGPFICSGKCLKNKRIIRACATCFPRPEARKRVNPSSKSPPPKV